MKPLHVLLVTYSFPPVGGTGVMRASSLARYLPGEGIRLDVLTARNASNVGADTALLKDIPAEVTVHRTLTLDLPFGVKKRIKRLIVGGKRPVEHSPAKGKGKQNFLKRVIEKILQPDPQVTWLPILTRAARRIVRQRKIDLVVITVPPFSSLLLVEKLRREFPDLAIVVDFRDEWLTTTFELVSFLFNASEHTRRIAQRAEAGAVAHATAIVTVTEAARGVIRSRYPQQPDSKFHLIPNGFDSTRLRRSAHTPAPRPDGKIVITYVGTVYASTEPAALVEAVRGLPEEVKSRFILRFIGHIEEPHFREALLDLGEMVELKGFLPQREALAAMDETDYVLLINHDPINVGGKFYDYIGAGKPILGAVHWNGATHRLLEEMRAGWCVGNRDVEGLRRLFLDVATHSSAMLASFQPDREKIAQYERKPLAERYARLLHSIAAGQFPDQTRSVPAKKGEPAC